MEVKNYHGDDSYTDAKNILVSTPQKKILLQEWLNALDWNHLRKIVWIHSPIFAISNSDIPNVFFVQMHPHHLLKSLYSILMTGGGFLNSKEVEMF